MDSCVVSYSKLASSEAGAVANQAEKLHPGSHYNVPSSLLLCLCTRVSIYHDAALHSNAQQQ